jgi:radical SAM protein with 4Fe4S-binding SPASM domain
MSCSDCINYTQSALQLFHKFAPPGGGDPLLPVSGSFELTLRCNIRCKHCYILFPGATSDELDTEQVKLVLNKLAAAGALFLLMTGGEILARPDFREIYLHAKSIGIVPTLFTNATLVDEDIVAFWKQYPPRSIEVTIYGHTEATYEAVTGVKGSFRRFRRGVQLMREAGLPLLLKTMVLKTNVHEFEQTREWVLSQGIRFRYDTNLTTRLDQDPSPLSERISPREHVRVESVDQDVNFARFGETLETAFGRPAKEDLFTCGTGIRTFHVDPQGRLHPCMLWRKNPYDLLNQEIDDRWRRHVWGIRNLAKAAAAGCNSCSNRGVCGRCAGSAMLETGDPAKNIEYYCEVAQERRKKFGEPISLAIETL